MNIIESGCNLVKGKTGLNYDFLCVISGFSQHFVGLHPPQVDGNDDRWIQMSWMALIRGGFI